MSTLPWTLNPPGFLGGSSSVSSSPASGDSTISRRLSSGRGRERLVRSTSGRRGLKSSRRRLSLFSDLVPIPGGCCSSTFPLDFRASSPSAQPFADWRNNAGVASLIRGPKSTKDRSLLDFHLKCMKHILLLR
jgi:hypothetical protein